MVERMTTGAQNNTDEVLSYYDRQRELTWQGEQMPRRIRSMPEPHSPNVAFSTQVRQALTRDVAELPVKPLAKGVFENGICFALGVLASKLKRALSRIHI